ncbi:MAG: glycosyltransferase family 4 protein [Oligoflexia bacterium]|nr:glycosyltransferase family 4 protein [Oligoflexia bacterium]
MKIGFDAKRIFHNFRGLGNYSRTLVESLQKYYPENDYVLFTPPFKDQRAKAWEKRNEEFQIVTPQSALDKTFSSAWRSLFLTNTLEKFDLDIYHGLSHELPPKIQKSNIKSVVTIHDLIFMRYPQFFSMVDRQVYKKKFQHAVDSADLVISICDQTRRDIIDFLNVPEEKIKTVYQSCAPSFYTLLKEDQLYTSLFKYRLPEKYILFVGAVEERKNVKTLIKSFARLKDQIPHNLVIVGDGKEYKKECLRLVADNNLWKRVTFLGHVSSEDLPAIYQGADLFVFPSLFEGWGIPIVEALFSDTPVITTEGGCFEESGGSYSRYVKPDNVDEIVEAMDQVINDDDLRIKMIRNGRLHAEKFHWKNTASNLINTYKEIL